MKNKGIKLAKKALQARPRRFSVVWMLPNFLTICALIFGLQAMYQALFNNWDNVIIMIIIASVFDMLDGRVARLLKSTFNEEELLWEVTANIEGSEISYQVPLLGDYVPLASLIPLLTIHYLGYDVQKAAKEFINFKSMDTMGGLKEVTSSSKSFRFYDHSHRGSLLGYSSALKDFIKLHPKNWFNNEFWSWLTAYINDLKNQHTLQSLPIQPLESVRLSLPPPIPLRLILRHELHQIEENARRPEYWSPSPWLHLHPAVRQPVECRHQLLLLAAQRAVEYDRIVELDPGRDRRPASAHRAAVLAVAGLCRCGAAGVEQLALVTGKWGAGGRAQRAVDQPHQ